MTDERQKKTTDEYRNNWDNIFKKKRPSDYQDILSTEDCILTENQNEDTPRTTT